MADARQIIQKIDSYADHLVEMQRQLVAVPALGPTSGGEGEMAKALLAQGWLEELGLATERIDAPDDRVPGGLRPNVAGRLPGGPGPAVWVLSHLDVVPAGEAGLWTSDPWTLRVDGDKVYGRGVHDNNAALVGSLLAVRALAELGHAPAGPVGLILVADEETGSGHGLDHVLKARPELFSPDDLLIVPDAGNEDGTLIEVAEKSMLWLKVTVTGKQVHGSTPHKGVNALAAAARMMCAVREVRAGFGQTDELFSPPGSTMEPTAKEAGVANINTIPGQDVFYIDCRVLPPIDLKDVLAAFTSRFEAIAAEEGAGVAIEPVQMLQAPPATPADAPVVRALQGAIRQVKGLEARPGGVGGGTVAAFFRQRGLPAAVWMTCPPTAHMPDEWASITDMLADAKVLALVMAGLAG